MEHLKTERLRLPSESDPFWPVKNWRVITWLVKFGQLMFTRETWARPEPINSLPERAGDARDFERDKAFPQPAIRPVSPKASELCQTYNV